MTANQPAYVSPQTCNLLKSILLGVVILAAGIVIGAGLAFLALSGRTPRADQEPEIFAEHLLGQLGRELNLTARQQQLLDPILQTHYRTLREIRASVRPEIVSQLEEMNHQIASVLDDRQQQLWQQKLRRLEDHFPTFRGPGRGYGPQDGRGLGGQRAPDERRGPGMGPGGGGGQWQNDAPGTQGQRQYLGPGLRRNERFDTSDPNSPRPEPPRVMEF